MSAGPVRTRAGMLLAGLLAVLLGAGLAIGRLGGGDPPAGPTPDPVASAGPSRSEPLRLQLPLPAELSPQQLDTALDQAVRAGVKEVGGGVTWWFLTRGRAPDEYDWTGVDRLVDGARSRGLTVWLQLSGTPDAVHPELAATVPDPDQRIWYPPRTGPQLAAWAGFVRDTVTHFRGRVTGYEMWNEPNIADFWKPAPDPAEYAALLQRAWTAARQADPAAQVVFGGLSHNDVGYLQAYYRAVPAGAAAHGWYFDVLDVHPYTDGRSPDDTSPDTATLGRYGLVDKSFAGLRLMKAAMDRQEGSSGKQVVVGEFGFTTTGTATAAAVDDRRRAYFLKRALTIADRLGVRSLSWYGYLPDSSNDAGWAIAGPDAYDSWTLQALRDAGAGAAVPLSLPAVPRPGTEVRPAVPGAEVVHTELWVDGTLRAEADGPAVTWPAGGGGGRVQVVAYTADRHAWPSPVVTVPAGG